MNILILIFLSSLACTNTNNSIAENAVVKAAQAQSTDKQEIIIEDISIKRKFDKTDEEMRFKFKIVEQKDEALVLQVNYGGGCVDHHVFELYSTGKPDENGVVDLFLLHKTTGDLCKMLIIQNRIFDINKLTKRKNFVSYRINGGAVQTVVKTK